MLLSAELVLAGWWRWSWTRAPIQTPFDYGTGHVAVVSENWRRHGALRQHFLPVLSIDPELPEWPYRTAFSQEYFSVPPLAFMLHYSATRLVPGVEPVLLGKLLAQVLVGASTIAAAFFLYQVFGAWATLIGLSFLIWSVPNLLWFANGYFAVNVGLAVQLVFVAWCAAVAASSLSEGDRSRLADVRMNVGLGAALAFLGGFADYLPLAGNAIAVVGLLAIAATARTGFGLFRAETCPRRPSGRALPLASAFGVLTGSLAALVATPILYGRQMGFARYREALAQRIADRSGDALAAEHVDVIRRQMLTAWPPEVLAVVIVMLCVVLAWCVASLARRRSRPESRPAVPVLLALAVSIVPSLGFHYRAVNYVRIHWWFAGTWAIGWAITVCAFVWLAGRLSRTYFSSCVAMLGLVVAANVRFVNLQSVDDPGRADAVRLYRSLGRDLPPDGFPLVVTDVTADRPGWFEDFPYATAYLRRPVLLRGPGEQVRLPSVEEPHNGEQVRFGGEDARERLLRRGGDVYVAYDPSARPCYGTDIPLSAWHRSVPIKVCRTSAASLVQRSETVLGPSNDPDACTGPPAPPRDLRVVSSTGRVVVLSWTGSLAKRTSYILEAGRSPGQTDALNTSVGRTATFTASEVKSGTYYARVRGRNACGKGAASNELIVVVE